MRNGSAIGQSPEALLAEIAAGQQTARRHLEREYQVFAQYGTAFSALLAEVLKGMGYRGAVRVV